MLKLKILMTKMRDNDTYAYDNFNYLTVYITCIEIFINLLPQKIFPHWNVKHWLLMSNKANRIRLIQLCVCVCKFKDFLLNQVSLSHDIKLDGN